MFSGYNIYQKKGSTRINKLGEKVVCERDYLIASKDIALPGTCWYIDPEVKLVHPDFKILEKDGTITVSLPNSYSSKNFYCVKITRDKNYPESCLDKVEEYPLSFKKVNKTPYKIHKYTGSSIKFYTKEEFRGLVEKGHKFKSTDKTYVLGINPSGSVYDETYAKYDYESDTFSGMDNELDVLTKPTSPMGIVVKDTVKYFPKWFRDDIYNFNRAKSIHARIANAIYLLEANKEQYSELAYACVDNEKIKLPFIKIHMTGPTAGWNGRFDEESVITLKETSDGLKYYVDYSMGSGCHQQFFDNADEAMDIACEAFYWKEWKHKIGWIRDVRTVELQFEPSGYGDCKVNYNARSQFVNQWKANNHFVPKERFMFKVDDRPIAVYASDKSAALIKAQEYAEKMHYKIVEDFEPRYPTEDMKYRSHCINIV